MRISLHIADDFLYAIKQQEECIGIPPAVFRIRFTVGVGSQFILVTSALFPDIFYSSGITKIKIMYINKPGKAAESTEAIM